MTKVLPNEIAFKIPGVQPVMNLTPFCSDMKVESGKSVTLNEYLPTTDTTFAEGKTYYRFVNHAYKPMVAGTDYAVGNPIVHGSVHEVSSTKTISATVTTIYDRYTEGRVTKLDTENDYPRVIEIPVEIVKTTVIQDPTTGDQLTTREHALAYWGARADASYVPICEVLQSNDYGASARMFR